MPDNLNEKSSNTFEMSYHFTTFDQLKKALEDNGWEKNKIDRCFTSLPSSLKVSFSERSMTRIELIKYANKLDAAQTQYEQINLLKQVALQGLKEDIGATISFENLGDLKKAIEERDIVYPGKYLEQPNSSFVNGWGGPRSLSMTAYESMIQNLKAVEENEEYVRGEIIAKAFNTPVPKSETAITAPQNSTTVTEKVTEVSYPDKSTAFANAIRSATSFPFVVRYSEGGKLYELPVNVNKNKIMVGEKVFTFTNSAGVTIESVSVDANNFLVRGSLLLVSKTQSMPKEEFIQNILPKLLTLQTSSSVNLMGYTVDVAVTGTENTKEIVGSSLSSSDSQKQVEQGVERMDIRDINSIKSTMQKMRPLLTAFETMSPENALAAEGSIGSILLARLAASGFRINIKNDLIQVIPSKPEDQAYATQLETYFRGEQGMNQIFGVGMMYRTSEYKNYAGVYLNPDNTVKPGNKRNYIEYLQDAKSKSGSQNMSQEDRDFLVSKESLEAILKDPKKVDQILLGTKFLTDGSSFLGKNPDILHNINIASISSQPQTTPASVPKGNNNQTPPTPSSTPQKLPSWEEAPIARALSEIGTGVSQGMNQISRTPGAMQGLLIGFALTWFFGGFKKALMFGAGAFGGSALISSLKKSGVDFGDLATEGAAALGKGADTVASAASGAKDAVTGTVTSTIAAAPPATPSQQKGIDRVKAHSTFSSEVSDFSAKNVRANAAEKGTFEDYQNFVHSPEFQRIPLEKFVYPSNLEQSIWSSSGAVDPSLKIPNSLSNSVFKKYLRLYLTGTPDLALVPQKPRGEQESLEFEKKYPKATYAGKTLADLTTAIYK